jgi:large subunit ribosomal protein L18e
MTTTNPDLQKLIVELKILSSKNEVKIWKKVANELEKPTRRRRHVNLYEIDEHSNDGDTILVPGKVLATGELTKQVKVVAFSFSQKAEEKLKDSSSIQTLIKENPKGSNVKIIC